MPLEATAVRLNFGNLMLPKGKVKSLFEEQARALPPSRSTERAKICYYPVSIRQSILALSRGKAKFLSKFS